MDTIHIFTNFYLEEGYPHFMENLGITTTRTVKRFKDKTNVSLPDDAMYGKPYIESIEITSNYIPIWLPYIYNSRYVNKIPRMSEISYNVFTSDYKYSNFKCLCVYNSKTQKQYLYLNPLAIDIGYYNQILDILDKNYKDITSDDAIYVYKDDYLPELVFISCSFIKEHGFDEDIFDLENNQPKEYITSNERFLFYKNIMTMSDTVDIVECAMRETYRFIDSTRYSVRAPKFYDGITNFIMKYMGQDSIIPNDKLYDIDDDTLKEYLGKDYTIPYNKFYDVLKELVKIHNGIYLAKYDTSIYGDFVPFYKIHEPGFYASIPTLDNIRIDGLISVDDAVKKLLYDNYGNSKKSIKGELLE